MERIPIAKAKARLTAVVSRVERTRQPVLLTRHGKPTVELRPHRPERSKRNWLGCLAGRTTIHGDLTRPVLNLNDVEALKP